jgi:hypothetical protein
MTVDSNCYRVVFHDDLIDAAERMLGTKDIHLRYVFL